MKPPKLLFWIRDVNAWIHFRFMFSFFLLPVFFFGLSQAKTINVLNSTILFLILHLFIYPASNIYNSFMDKDSGSIGGLKNPPPVNDNLYYASICFDVTGLLLCLFVDVKLMLLIIPYILVSKAYSWNKTRLKKYGILGWLVVILFQGGYTFMFVNMTAENNFSPEWFNAKNLEGMFIASLLIGAFYPLTQIYQHEEDYSRGDKTISYLLGIRGTFIFSAIIFLISLLTSAYYFNRYYSLNHFYYLLIAFIPGMIYFFYWMIKSWKNISSADYSSTMRMTFISSTSMIVLFIFLMVINHS